MSIHKRISLVLAVMLASLALAACAPKLGSERWCKAMDDKPKGDWSANDAAAYTKHCVLGIEPE
ncbi:MAG: DUF3012 domain-containing protein [Proteobacteria bacterium]|nr:DUF3012 domain-containing protein [Pseudomonadota bacterium]